MDSYVIGVDIGGTGTKYGIVDKDGNVLHSSSMATNTHAQVHTFIDELYDKLSELIEKVGGVGRIKGIGVGAPNGNIYTGTIEYAPNLPSVSCLYILTMHHSHLWKNHNFESYPRSYRIYFEFY